jgi:hypothetical protein
MVLRVVVFGYSDTADLFAFVDLDGMPRPTTPSVTTGNICGY